MENRSVSLIAVPYDSGHRALRMGSGPEFLLERGLARQLEQLGHTVRLSVIETSGDAHTSAFDIARQVAEHTRRADRDGAFPVILAGNCITSLGGLAGLHMRTALLWLDAHADFNTPATSPSGFLDGMALAVITGRCHAVDASAIDGFTPLPDDRVIMLGVRSIDAGEESVLRSVTVARSSRELWQILAKADVDELYLHVDLDVLDPSELKANSFATPYGISLHTLHDVVTTATTAKRVAALRLDTSSFL